MRHIYMMPFITQEAQSLISGCGRQIGTPRSADDCPKKHGAESLAKDAIHEITVAFNSVVVIVLVSFLKTLLCVCSVPPAEGMAVYPTEQIMLDLHIHQHLFLSFPCVRVSINCLFSVPFKK